MDDQLPDFAGKTVLVYIDRTHEDERGSEYLIHPRFERQGDRLFLVGEHPSAGGFTIGVPWAVVRKYIVADSLEAFRRFANS